MHIYFNNRVLDHNAFNAFTKLLGLVNDDSLKAVEVDMVSSTDTRKNVERKLVALLHNYLSI